MTCINDRLDKKNPVRNRTPYMPEYGISAVPQIEILQIFQGTPLHPFSLRLCPGISGIAGNDLLGRAKEPSFRGTRRKKTVFSPRIFRRKNNKTLPGAPAGTG